MGNKLKLASFTKFCKGLSRSILTALAKPFTRSKAKKLNYPHKSPANIFKQITQEHTQQLNRWILILLLISSIAIIVVVIYGDKNKFAQLVQNKTKITHAQIDRSIRNFQQSLAIIKDTLLRDKKYLDPQKLVQVLKFTYISDKHIRFLPLVWHQWSNQPQSCTAQGCTNEQPDESLISRLNQNPEKLMIYDRLEHNGETNIVIIFPVAEQVKSSKASSTPILVGYLELSIKTSVILHDLYYRLDEDDLIKISNDRETLYFAKQDNKFWFVQEPELYKYQFADEVSFSPYLYKVSVGSISKTWLMSSIQRAILYCISIVIFSSIILFIYSYIERKKIKYSYNQKFLGKLLAQQEQIESLTMQLDESNLKIEDLVQQNHNYLDAMQIMTSIEQEVRQCNIAALLKIRDSNALLLKHYSKKKELKIDQVEKLFAIINDLSEDLHHNIFNRSDKATSVKITDLFAEILRLLAPVITSRNIAITNHIGHFNIEINTLILKQILMSLLIKRLYSIPKNSNLSIITHKDSRMNRVTIEINDDGVGINEDIIEDILYMKKKNFIPGMMHVQLSLGTIETSIKEQLGGDITMVSNDHSNNITLLLPLEINLDNNIVPLPKIVGGNK